MPTERLSSLDASFLYLERPAMHMHVAGVSVFAPREDGPLTYEDVAEVATARLHLAPRLRQRVLNLPGGLTRPLWVDDDHFDLDFHLRRAAIPAPGRRLQLERAVGRVLSRPLDRGKPLWELYVFEGLEDDRTAVLLKMHHALADGISGMLIASALFDLSPDADVGTPPKEPWVPEPAPTGLELADRRRARSGAAPDGGPRPGGGGADARRGRRRRDARRAPIDRRDGSSAPWTVRRARRAQSPVRDRRGAVRAAPRRQARRWAARSTTRCSPGSAGACTICLDARGEQTRGRTLRVMVPVSVRSKAEQGDVGNRVAPAFVDIPVGTLRPATRLRRVRAATDALKGSAMAVSADSIIGLGAYAPPALHAMAARLVSRNRWFNLVVSNIPAPQVPMYLAGAQLMASYPAMPLGESCALSIACTSLGGTMSFGLTADWDALPDIEVLARGIERSLRDLADARSDLRSA